MKLSDIWKQVIWDNHLPESNKRYLYKQRLDGLSTSFRTSEENSNMLRETSHYPNRQRGQQQTTHDTKYNKDKLNTLRIWANFFQNKPLGVPNI